MPPQVSEKKFLEPLGGQTEEARSEIRGKGTETKELVRRKRQPAGTGVNRPANKQKERRSYKCREYTPQKIRQGEVPKSKYWGGALRVLIVFGTV